MRRIVGTALAVATAVLLSTGCSEPSGPSDSLAVPPSPSRTVVVDSTRMALRGNAAERVQGIYRFAMIGAPQRIEAGDVIVGVQDGGFLRRVTGARTAGSELVLDTRAAGLDEALGEGSFRGSIAVSAAAGAVRGPSYTLGPATTEAVANGISLDSTGLRFDNTIIFNSRSCSPPAGTCGQITFGITSGLVGFTSALDIGSTTRQPLGLSAAYLRVDGTATLSIDAFAEIRGAMAGGPWQRTLARQSRPFAMLVGGIPVVGKVSVELVGELSAEASGPARVDAGFTSRTTASVGAGWTADRGFYKIQGRSHQAGRRPVQITSYPRAEFFFTVWPRVNVSFYGGTAQSYAGVKPYMAFQLSPFPGLDVARTRVDVGVKAVAGVNFNLFSQTLGTYNYESHLLEQLLSLDEFTIPRVPTGIFRYSGNLQSARTGTLLPDPLVVRVVNDWYKPVAGVRVNFTVTSGGGSLSTISGVTDASGRVQTRWTLGPVRGTQFVTVSSPAIPGRTTQFRATGHVP